MDQQIRHLAWEACYNVRDLGGLETAAGDRIRWGAVIRSDIPSRLTAAGKKALLDHGVRTIIDLRHPAEVAETPSIFTEPETIAGQPAYLNLALETPDPALQKRINEAKSRTEIYCLALDHATEAIATITRAILNAAEGGVLLHCQAGKDRTGVIVALLLGLAGVPPAAIAADYAASEANLWPLYRKMEAEAAGDPEKLAGLRHKIPTAPPETMLEVLAHLQARYGGVRDYLLATGLTEQELEPLRRRLCL